MLAFCGLASCRAAEPGGASPLPEQPQLQPGETAPDELSPPSAPNFQGGDGVPALGAPCGAPNASDPEHTLDPCGTKRRISVRWNPSSSLTASDAPCRLRKVGQVGMDVQGACVSDGRLYAARWCVPCRVVGAGWSVVAELAETTRPQARAIQERLGLPGGTLVSAGDWEKAISARR